MPRRWKRLLLIIFGVIAVHYLLNSSLLKHKCQKGFDCDTTGPSQNIVIELLKEKILVNNKAQVYQAHQGIVYKSNNGLEKLDMIMNGLWQWEWIQNRIHNMWDEWQLSASKINVSHKTKQKRILIVPGVLSLTDFARPNVIAKGGPLGELVQWADIIAALYVLGHQLELQHDISKAADSLENMVGNCHEFDPGCGCIDLIYTDYGGIQNLPRTVRANYKYRFRILDVYGTEAMFNNGPYARRHNIPDLVGLDLHLKQFLTMYPMTPDNTFLGFAVSGKKLRSSLNKNRKIGLVYGKEVKYLKFQLPFIWALKELLDLYATMPQADSQLKSLNVFNLGLVSNEQFQEITSQTKVLIGLGDPVEGTGVMEALAGGAIFLNPSFSGEQQIRPFRHKPTTRQLTSQVPYLERYVGRPYVLTVNTENVTDVKVKLKEIMKEHDETTDEGFLPYEFTVEGYLQRLSIHVENQDFCHSSHQWPPKTSLKFRLGKPGESCNYVCDKDDLVCEPSLFNIINNISYFHNIPECQVPNKEEDIYFPAVQKTDGNLKCLLQANPELYSCAGGHLDIRRLCPCRNYMKSPKQQVALCQECV